MDTWQTQLEKLGIDEMDHFLLSSDDMAEFTLSSGRVKGEWEK